MKVVSDLKIDSTELGLAWDMNTDGAGIHFKNSSNNDTDSYLELKTRDDENEYFKFTHQSCGNEDEEWATIKKDGMRLNGYKVYNENFKPTPQDIGAAQEVHIHSTQKTDEESNGLIIDTTGFKRPNGSQHKNSNIPFTDLVMHITHPDCAHGEHSRGIGFQYGSQGTALCTYAFDANGDFKKSSVIYTDTNRPTPYEIGAADKEHTHDHVIASQLDGKSLLNKDGLSTSRIYQNDYPYEYGNTINISNSRGFNQIALEWPDKNQELGRMAIRNKRDSCNEWSEWDQVYTHNFKPTPSEIGAAETAHTHAYIVSQDTRERDDAPSVIYPGLYADFKSSSINGLNVGEHNGVLTFRPYGVGDDFSGGPSHQIGFATNGKLFKRTGSNDHWDKWGEIFNSNHDISLGEGTMILSQFDIGMKTLNKDNSGSYNLIRGYGDNDIEIGDTGQHVEMHGSLAFKTTMATGIRMRGDTKDLIITTEAKDSNITFLGVGPTNSDNIDVGLTFNSSTKSVEIVDEYGSNRIYTDKTIPIFSSTNIVAGGIVKVQDGIVDTDWKIRLHNNSENGYGELTGHSGWIEATTSLSMGSGQTLSVENECGITSKMSNGSYEHMIGVNHNDDMILGCGMQNKSIYANYGQIYLNNKKVSVEADYGALWTGTIYLTATQTAVPSKALSDCKNGWMLQWSNYDNESCKANDWNFAYTYIHKNQKQNVYTYDVLGLGKNDQFCTKAYYFDNSTLYGYDQNTTAGTSVNKVLVAIYEW